MRDFCILISLYCLCCCCCCYLIPVSPFAQALGFTFVELNASDRRSKKSLKEEVAEYLQSSSLSSAFQRASSSSSSEGKATDKKHVLLMDEVDGMAGNEDRGGMQELIQLVKTTKIPIICMCNDRLVAAAGLGVFSVVVEKLCRQK